MMADTHSWSGGDAALLYGVPEWSAGYFAVSEQGELQVVGRPPPAPRGGGGGGG
jgi:arginine decarboxylase-like protein